MGANREAIDKGTGTCFYCIYCLFGNLVYLDAKLPSPGYRGKGLGLPTGQDSLPSLKVGGGGRRVNGGAGEEWEEGRKCKFLNGK